MFKGGVIMAAGHPPLYDNEIELGNKIDEYFDQCKPVYLKDEEGHVITDKKGGYVLTNLNAPSLSGLALYLGYASRQSIYDNEKNDKFSYIIKRARSRVEEWIYQHSLDASVPAAVGIFILKQFGYTDKQEIEHSGGMTNKIDITRYTEEELKQLAELNRKNRS